jgi:hypothetical protein
MDPHGRNKDKEEYTEDLIRDGEDITSYLNLEGGDDSSSHGMDGEDDDSGGERTLVITKSGEVCGLSLS